jgi:excisionase family DNA binding protein
LHDLIEARSGSTRTSRTSEEDYKEIYDLMTTRLTARQLKVVNMRFGLNQTAPITADQYRNETGRRISFENVLSEVYPKLRRELAPEPAPPVIPPEVVYARELAAWNAGNQSCRLLAQALKVCENTALSRMKAMRDAGLIQYKPCSNSSYWFQGAKNRRNTSEAEIPPSEWVNAAQAARLTGLGEKTIRRKLKAGEIEAEKQGGVYQISVGELEKLTKRVQHHW